MARCEVGRLGRPRKAWEDNIKKDLQDVGREFGLN
jgi:hypothetical protein